MILSNMAWRLRVRRSRLLQIDSNEKQELVYEGTVAPALWFINISENKIPLLQTAQIFFIILKSMVKY